MNSIAIHEAGHAVAALLQDIPIIDCTLAHAGEAGRVNLTDFVPEGASYDALVRYAITYLAGWQAQLVREPDLNLEVFHTSIESDMFNARRCIGNAVVNWPPFRPDTWA